MTRICLRLVSVILAITATTVVTKDIQVKLHAGWSGTPVVAEIAEFLWTEGDSHSFWEFLEQWPPIEKDMALNNCWSLLHKKAAKQLSPEFKRLLGLVLSLRLMSPKVEMRQQLSKHFSSENCCWIELPSATNTQVISDPEEFKQAIDKAEIGDIEEVFEFDFEYPPSPDRSKNVTVVILYGAIGSQCFQQLHAIIKAAAENRRIRYIFRPVFNAKACATQMDQCSLLGTADSVILGGFGAELAIKSTEYSAVNEAANSTESTTVEMEPVVEKIGELGLQTAQSILSADDPLGTFTKILQDYPTHVPSLSNTTVTPKLRRSVDTVSRILPSRKEFALLNGIPIRLTDFDFITFFDSLRTDLRIRHELQKLQFSDALIIELLKLRAHDLTEELADVRYDVLPVDHVVFMNNIEKESTYRSYHKSLDILFSPFAGGGIVPIRRNLFNCVFFTELTSPSGSALANLVLLLQQQKAPLRVGIVPVSSSFCGSEKKLNEAEENMIRYFVALSKTLGGKAAFAFWLAAVQTQDDIAAVAQSTFEVFYKKSGSTTDSISSLEQALTVVDENLRALESEIQRSGLCQMDLGSFLWLNGRIVELDAATLDRMTIYNIQLETQILQRLVYIGAVSDEDKDLLQSILASQTTFNKYAPYIDATPPEIQYMSMNLRHFENDVTFVVHPNHATTEKSVTHWIVGNIGSRVGLEVVRSGLEFMLSPQGRSAQIAFAVVSADACPLQRLWRQLPLDAATHRSEIILFWIKILSNHVAVNALLDIDQSQQQQIKDSVQKLCSTISCQNSVSVEAIFAKSSCDNLNSPAIESFDLQIDATSHVAVVSNGRVTIPGASCYKQRTTDNGNTSCGTFSSEDFVILQTISEEYQLAKLITPIISKSLNESNNADLSSLTAITASILRHHHVNVPSEAATLQNVFERLDHGVLVKSSFDEAKGVAFELEAVLDPISVTAQRFIPVVHFLSELFSPKISIFLNPYIKIDEMPLKQFYRLALPRLQFTKDSSLVNLSSPKALFKNLPQSQLLTLNPETPSAWLIEPLEAKLDLDNIRLRDAVEDMLSVEYGLESILLTGSCLDTTARSRRDVYPRGLQLNLGHDKERVLVDTLVMSNLGYFQLKANPGVWHLSLADGRSRELYFIDSEMSNNPELRLETTALSEPKSLRLVIDSFGGKILGLRVRKRKGRESEDVLDISNTPSSTIGTSQLINTVLRWSGLKTVVKNHQHLSTDSSASNWQGCSYPDDPVNVFTIASGHMYERLQKIMILSVLRNTKSCVKFWFIKNYMSPQIKDFLPHFAKKYAFEYTLITYKWPSWLHYQTEKQRRIWAYKILFLDVLFPLNVRKVLFLDSDQIIRADIRTLYDMDLHGAPLAYTPFCDNNKEMDGFRFWKGGFWEGHLKGKPYHISALFVVDLVRFRQMAAGDHLRVVYAQLSQDPNSLSNLDQDLPNYTQHQVPIFSLPQEWLWCETWCGNETKQTAKTIDLCNNPLTKEPKLQSARRIVQEWTALDNEAQEFAQGIEATCRLDVDGHDRGSGMVIKQDKTEL